MTCSRQKRDCRYRRCGRNLKIAPIMRSAESQIRVPPTPDEGGPCVKVAMIDVENAQRASLLKRECEVERTDHRADPAHPVVIIEGVCRCTTSVRLLLCQYHSISPRKHPYASEPKAKQSREEVLHGDLLGKMSKVLGITKTLCELHT